MSYKVIVLKTPQPVEVDLQEFLQIAEYAHTRGRSITASVDDMLRLMHNPDANAASYVEVYRSELPSQQAAINLLEQAGFNWIDITQSIFPLPFRYTYWPTNSRQVTQYFGERPEVYSHYMCNGVRLHGHEGIDIAAVHGSPIYAPADGVVSDIHPIEGTHNYGIFLRIDHEHGFQTTLAHLDSLSVDLHDIVTAGQIVGYADSTGNSTGSHLHLMMKRPGYIYMDAQGNVWPCNIHDPGPYLLHLRGQSSAVI